VGGTWERVTDYDVHKADSPVLDITPTPRTDGRGESELGLSGEVEHLNNRGRREADHDKFPYSKVTMPGGSCPTLPRVNGA